MQDIKFKLDTNLTDEEKETIKNGNYCLIIDKKKTIDEIVAIISPANTPVEEIPLFLKGDITYNYSDEEYSSYGVLITRNYCSTLISIRNVKVLQVKIKNTDGSVIFSQYNCSVLTRDNSSAEGKYLTDNYPMIHNGWNSPPGVYFSGSSIRMYDNKVFTEKVTTIKENLSESGVIQDRTICIGILDLKRHQISPYSYSEEVNFVRERPYAKKFVNLFLYGGDLQSNYLVDLIPSVSKDLKCGVKTPALRWVGFVPGKSYPRMEIKYKDMVIGEVSCLNGGIPKIVSYYPLHNYIGNYPRVFIEHLVTEGLKLIDLMTQTPEVCIAKTKSLVDKLLESRLKSLDEDIRSELCEIRTHQKKILESSQNIKEQESLKQKIIQKKDTFSEEITNGINRLAKHKFIKTVQFNCEKMGEKIQNPDLVITTKFISVRSEFTGLLHALGRFKVEIKFSDEDADEIIRISNLDWVRKGYWREGVVTPHVSAKGIACFGNVAQAVNELLASYDVFGLGYTLLNYLQEVNEHDGAGRQLYRFPVIIDDKIILTEMSENAMGKFRAIYSDSGNKKQFTYDEIVITMTRYPEDCDSDDPSEDNTDTVLEEVPLSNFMN
jgi:hypothetical protein